MNKTIRYHIKWFHVYQTMNSGKVSVQLLNLLVYYCDSKQISKEIRYNITMEIKSILSWMQHCYAQDNLPTYLNSVVRHIVLYRFMKTKFIFDNDRKILNRLSKEFGKP